jgi:hypothetical protein
MLLYVAKSTTLSYRRTAGVNGFGSTFRWRFRQVAFQGAPDISETIEGPAPKGVASYRVRVVGSDVEIEV